MRSSMSMSCRNIQRDAFITANSRMPIECANIPGDIPTLMRSAFTHEFGEVIPDDDGEAEPATADEVASAIAALGLHHRSAIDLVNRVTAILTRGPQLSMNIPLAPGEDLPPRIFTLLQGTIWALLVEAGANPDIQDRLLTRSQAMYPDATDLHNKIRKALTPEARCLWFLCRKFFFTLNVAEKDGECFDIISFYGSYHHRAYMGRLFMLHTFYHTAYTRARMPRVLELFNDRLAHGAVTPKGLWGWGENSFSQLGFESSGFITPTRLDFRACSAVAKADSRLKPWHKDRMITGISMANGHNFILTTVGAVMAGDQAGWYVGPVQGSLRFHPVAVPAGFVPDHVMNEHSTVVLSMGHRQMISGDNDYGRLGLGHEEGMTGFVDLPFKVDQIVASGTEYNIFVSGRQLVFAGYVLSHIAQLDLLPEFSRGDKCLVAATLQFPEHVSGLFVCDDWMAWVGVDRTYVCQALTGSFERSFMVPFEVTAASLGRRDFYFRGSSGQWFRASSTGGGVATMSEWQTCSRYEEITPVDVDPWAEQSRTSSPVSLSELGEVNLHACR
ncbi:hypothetical protein J8273_3535 [Carpediemonas membranifera]|uniref:Uncharacterized protein n=1 Tax=Carpediemonas membranifera TaxID=201153 RepID=A0A8J6DZB6_9EUKA|nr:hypothetical protein J8273_3535 [Carpediemonas membranifera]|eukprot:KAG9393399.1 hypothetical protein J8273_3535 [Carpediemonas membranifera]